MKEIVLLVILIMIVAFLKSFLEKLVDKKVNEFPYIKKEYIMTKAEIEFFKILEEISIKNNWKLFAQVRLLDIINTKPKTKVEHFNKIKSKHIDFIICDKEFKILIAIELNDKSHEREDRAKRDILISDIFKSVKMPFIAFKTSYKYDTTEIENKLLELLNTASINN